MLKYAKIINEQTKDVEIGIGCSDNYHIKNGMTIMDAKQSYNSKWYIKCFESEKPKPTIEEMKIIVRDVRNEYLYYYDFTQLSDAQYRQYLRNYTKQPNWWKQKPKTFEEWSK